MIISFEHNAFEEYLLWAKEDKKIFNKIGRLIIEISRDPFKGIGKPEPLKHDYSGFWSPRITDEHRLIYAVEKDTIYIAGCKYHYPKK